MSRPVLYPLRPLESATVRYTAAPHHRRRVTIDHRPLSGITPAMLLDWFTHIGDTMAYGGEIVDRYLAWHPIDHIYWGLARPAPGGGAGEGARFRIVEAFGGRPEFRVDVVDRVEKLDETGIRLAPAGRWSRDFPTRAHLVGGRGRRALRQCDGHRRPVGADVTHQQDRVSALSRRDGACLGSAQHRRGRATGIPAAATQVR